MNKQYQIETNIEASRDHCIHSSYLTEALLVEEK